MHNSILRKFGLFISLSIALGCIIGCDLKNEQSRLVPLEKITIAMVPWPASAPVYVAKDKGYFQEEGLDAAIEPVATGQLGLDAILSGKMDLTGAANTPIARTVLNDKPLAIITTIAELLRTNLIIARKDKDIALPTDLRGKTVAVTAGTAAEFFLHTFLSTSHIDKKDLRIINLPADKIMPALLEGRVDAVSTWSPYTIILQKKLGRNGLTLDEPILNKNSWNMVTTQEFTKNHPERVRRFLRAIIKANRFIKEHPDQAHTIAAKYIGIDSLIYEEEWEDYFFTHTLDQNLILQLEDQARWFLKRDAGSRRLTPNFMNFIHAAPLKALQPEAVTVPGK